MEADIEPPGVVDPREVTLGALFWGFLRIALSGFGGVLAWARWSIVEKRRWVSEREFTDMLSLCQFLPGPNIINLSIYLGARFQGPAGALAAFAGLTAIPLVLVLSLGMLFQAGGDLAVVRGAFRGIAAGAAGLVIATALKMALPHRRDPLALLVGAAAFVTVGLLRWPMVEVLLALAPIAVLIAWVRRRR